MSIQWHFVNLQNEHSVTLCEDVNIPWVIFHQLKGFCVSFLIKSRSIVDPRKSIYSKDSSNYDAIYRFPNVCDI